MKNKLAAVAVSLLSICGANAAIYNINNVASGPGDTLYASSSNSLLTGAIVTMGVFPAGFDVNANLGNTALLVSQFTVLASGLTGGPSATLGGSFAGYAEYDPVDAAAITGADPLLGRTLYSFIGNAATLGASTEFGLVLLATITDDVPVERSYTSNPDGLTPLIGSIGTFNGDAGAGAGVYQTLQLSAIPEPSVALLGLLGAVGFFRRRR